MRINGKRGEKNVHRNKFEIFKEGLGFFTLNKIKMLFELFTLL